MNINWIILLLCSFLAVSCSGQEDTTVILKKVTSYTLPLPDSIAPNSFAQKICAGCSGSVDEWLYYLSDDEDLIVIYNLGSESIIDVVPLFQQGPNNVGDVVGFSILNKDSIFLSAIGKAGNEILDMEGNIVKDITFAWQENQLPDFTSLASQFYADLSFDGNSFFSPQSIPIYGYKPPTTNHRPIVKHDIKNGESQLLDFRFPQQYYEANYPLTPLFSSDKESLYFGLLKHHHVFQINKITEKVDSVKVKSHYAPEIFKNKNGLGTIAEVKGYMAGTVSYIAILPDPYRDYIYRIVSLPPINRERLDEAMSQIFSIPDRFSIIVCDKDLNILHEQVFEERTYYPYGIFITKEGINIPKTHPDYFLERGVEDEMEYDVFAPDFK